MRDLDNSRVMADTAFVKLFPPGTGAEPLPGVVPGDY